MLPPIESNTVEVDVVLERNRGTDVWIAEAVGISGAYAQGGSREEALANIREVLQLIKKTDGLPARPQVEFVRVEA